MKQLALAVASALALWGSFPGTTMAAGDSMAPTKDDQKWLFSGPPPSPADNQPTPERVELGKMLFFDPRLSSERNLACANCHNPVFGWTDGLPTAKGFKSKVLGRETPTIVNSGYTTLQMWDGRRASLEDQAMGPMESQDEMAMDLSALFSWLNSNPTYQAAFSRAYPGEAVDKATTSKAIAAFERTIISDDSPFDRWVRGDKTAMSARQVHGFRLFEDPAKGNCAVCHAAPNFTDGGFHNIGLAVYGRTNPDVGRFAIKPLPSLKGAFKTPTLRDIALTAPYFHDGSARSLIEVVEHYNKGGETKTDLSPEIKPLNLTREEMQDIVAFMQALTTPPKPVTLPLLPAN